MNPALTYLAGIYFLNFAQNASDFDTARTYLSRAVGMVQSAEFINDDIVLAKSCAEPQNITWVFIESGFSPKLTERRIDWPIFTLNGIQTVSIAVAKPVFFVNMPEIDGAELMSDVDAMFMTEFKEYQANAAIRVMASVLTKAVIQSAATQYAGPLGNIAAITAGTAGTSAEVRTWATLPKRIYVLRVQNQSLIELKSGGKILSEIEMPESGNYLVYIRLLDKNISPRIIKLKG